jgi:hypothetical protein
MEHAEPGAAFFDREPSLGKRDRGEGPDQSHRERVVACVVLTCHPVRGPRWDPLGLRVPSWRPEASMNPYGSISAMYRRGRHCRKKASSVLL